MRLLSTLISSFVFASVLEHRKIFARAEDVKISDTTWAGVWKNVPHALDPGTGRQVMGAGFVFISARFKVPYVWGGYAFLGITLSSPRCGEVSISNGIMLGGSPHSPEWSYQVGQEPLQIRNDIPAIVPNNFITTTILVSGTHALLLVINETAEWAGAIVVNTLSEMPFCEEIAEWKLATIEKVAAVGRDRLTPFPTFLRKIKLEDARTLDANGYFQAAGRGNSGTQNILNDFHGTVDTTVNANDPSLIEFEKV